MSLYLALATSGLGPTLYIIMESDLRTLSHRNLLCKYADDTKPHCSYSRPNSDIGLHDEFSHICNWAKANKMIINLGKTKEIVFGRPNARSFHMPLPISSIEPVDVVNSLGTSGYATWFTVAGAIRIAHYDVIDDVITRKL